MEDEKPGAEFCSAAVKMEKYRVEVKRPNVEYGSVVKSEEVEMESEGAVVKSEEVRWKSGNMNWILITVLSNWNNWSNSKEA